ncbi:MAG: hypothetical protein ACOCY7_01000 [Halodesulfurarchaeum sp.]
MTVTSTSTSTTTTTRTTPTATTSATATPATTSTKSQSSAPAEAEFDIAATALNTSTITAGETVLIALEVENTGDRDGPFGTNLIVDDETVDSDTVTVEEGESETVVFEHRFDDPGEYEMAIDDTVIDTLTVTTEVESETATSQTEDAAEGGDTDEAIENGEADNEEHPIEIVDAVVPADEVRTGFETTAKVTVVNRGNRTVNRTLTVTVDGEPVANETVTLTPNEREVVSILFEPAGETASVAVEGIDAGTVVVSESLGETRTVTEDAPDESESRLDLGLTMFVGAIVIGIVSGVVLVARQI